MCGKSWRCQHTRIRDAERALGTQQTLLCPKPSGTLRLTGGASLCKIEHNAPTSPHVASALLEVEGRAGATIFAISPCLPALLFVLRYGSPALGFFSQPAPALGHVTLAQVEGIRRRTADSP